jgi:hypothetical protein
MGDPEKKRLKAAAKLEKKRAKAALKAGASPSPPTPAGPSPAVRFAESVRGLLYLVLGLGGTHSEDAAGIRVVRGSCDDPTHDSLRSLCVPPTLRLVR